MAFPFDVLSWLIRGRYKVTPPALADGEAGEIRVDSSGRVLVVVDSATPPTVSYHDTVEPAGKAEIKATAGSLHELWGFNDGETTVYLQIHDSSGEPDPATVPVMVFKLAAGASFSFALKSPRAFTNGIYWAASEVPGGYTSAVASLVVGATYQ